MLLCQDLRRYHHHTLIAVFNRLYQGIGGNDCLTRAHIPLKEPVHGSFPFHIPGDFRQGPFLGSR